jgi:hypothetical protein
MLQRNRLDGDKADILRLSAKASREANDGSVGLHQQVRAF